MSARKPLLLPSAHSPYTAYIEFTRRLILAKRIFSEVLTFKAANEVEPQPLKTIYDEVFEFKKLNRCGRELPFTDWLVNGVFPQFLYEECGKSLQSINDDKRFYDEPTFSRKDGWSSFFGRSMRKREGLDTSFMEYLLKRLANKEQRCMPHFYFSTEDPHWALAPLVNNPKLLKTFRTSVACMMNISLSAVSGEFHVNLIMRSNQWSHLYGDVWGGNCLANALSKQFDLPRAQVHIFSPQYNMDQPVKAKKLLQRV